MTYVYLKERLQGTNIKQGCPGSKQRQDTTCGINVNMGVRHAEVKGASKPWLDLIHPGANDGLLAMAGGSKHPPALTRKSWLNNS